MAEDQSFIALDLALAIEDAGGQVVGPAASCKEAMALLATNTVVGAIMDVNLADGVCSAVVEALVGMGASVILQTGVGLPPDLAARFPNLIVHIKPCVAAKLVAQLEVLIAEHERPLGAGASYG